MTTPRFNGADYVPSRDDERLGSQMSRIFNVMKDGTWRALVHISTETGDREASISAQLRHLRKARFGGHKVERRYMGNGLYQYRIEPKEITF